ncbi:hypothetical protein 20Sep420_00108 [Pseudomonas phage 20Sep420]|nr:hypothetical protein 20Sep420_00108 [Pseudomonas phage 20Sep420]
MDHNESRFILTPNPVALAGQKNVPLDLRPGESLYAFLNRHVPGLDEGKWVAVVNGEVVERQDWFTTFPKDGQLIELRGDVAGKSVLMIVAMVALTVFTFGIGAAAAFSVYGAAMAAGMGSMAATLAATAVYMVGAMLIQKVLGPKQETPAAQDTSRLNSLNGTNNRMRPYEPFGLLFGEDVKISPDVLSRPYGYFQGDDQYLDMILTPGFNVHSVGPFMNGTTPLSDYQDVKVYHNNFSGMPSVDIPMLTNTFELPGGKLSADDKGTPGPVINRTTGANTIMFSVGVAWTLYGVTRKGKDSYNQETIRIRYRPTGTNDWTQRDYSIRNIDKKEHRTEYRFEVPEGMYDIEVQALGRNSTGNSDQQSFQLTSIITARPDPTDYSFIPRIGINMKASGQLNGAPNELTTHATAKPTPVWNGTTWETKTTSNPGAQILQYLRGIYSDDGELLAGMGLPDEEIDIESLKAFMLHCAEHKFEYRHWITDKRSHENVIQSIANVAMGQMTTAGGKWAATWAAEDQPFTGVVNMATMTDASFEVSYTLANAADGIEYTYYNKTTDKTETVRVKSPTSTIDPINPATLTGEGVTDPEHAATLARYFLGQSLFQYKDISYGTAAEALSYKRMDKLMLQHDLTQWGFGGRVVSATRISGGRVQIVLDEPVPEFPTPFLGVRALGERVCRIFHVEPFSGTSNTLILRQGPGATGDVWPSDMPFPTADQAPNFIWMYDFKATPGYPVRVVSIDPDFDQLAKVAVVWEGPEFWNYVYRGQYQRPDNASSLTDPQVQNLLANDYQVIQGNTRFTECQLTWEVVGNVRDCNVYMAGPDGILTQVGSNLTTRSHTFRLDYLQTYTFVVVPNSIGGVPGKPARIEYLPQTMGGGPALVDLFDVEDKVGGIRRYTWGFQTTTMSPDFDGVEIRYIAGATTGVPVWDSMIPLGDEDGFFTSAVEAVLPPAGLWTFACRSRNTSGELSGGMRYFSKTLRADIGENVDNAISGVENVKTDLEKEINDRIDGDIETAKKAAEDLKAVNDALGQRITENANAISQQAGQIAQNTNGLAQEILDRVAGDLNTEVNLTTKITEEKEARETDVENLTRMISSISAGSGEQFDQAPNSMWYFDKTVEGWSGVYGTPTIVDGWLRPANNTSGQNTGIQSPVISVDGAAYRFIKTRVRRKGNPQWLGLVRWITEADQNWNDAKSVTITEPTWNSNGIGNIEHADLPWNSGSPIRAIRFTFTGQQTDTNSIEFDWIAIGRPTPGASVAMVQEEAQARIAADTTEALKRETLGVQMRGDYEGSDVAGVQQGLIASEKNARIDGDRVNAQAIQALTARMPAGNGKVASEASVTQLQQAMVSADEALGQRIDSLTAIVGDKASAAALEALTLRVTNVEGKAESTAQSVTKLNSNIGDAVNYSVIASSSISSSPSGAPRSSGVYRANGSAYPGLGASRGIRVATIKTDNTFADTQVFDTYGDLVNNAIRFNAWYDAMTPNTWFLIYTSDAFGNIGTSTDANVIKMRANLIDAGMAAQDVSALGPNMFALIGRKLLSGGNGLYQVSPNTQSGGTSGSRDGVYVNMPFSLLGGVPMQQGDNARLSAATSAAAEAVQSLTTRVAETEGKVESMAESVTSLTAKSNIALIGSGSNMWQNPTFMYGIDPWAAITGSNVTWVSGGGQQGSALKMERITGTVSAAVASNLRTWTSIEVGPLGRRIQQTVIARSLTGGNSRLLIRLRVRSGAGESNNDQFVTVTPDWQRFTVVHPIGDDRNEIMGELHLGADNAIGTAIAIDRFEAFDITQEGRIDANAGAISSLQASVKTIGDTTNANAQNIVKLNSQVGVVINGGNNLFPMGSFEQGTDGEQATGAQAGGTTFTYRAASRRTGKIGLGISIAQGNSSNADLYIGEYIPVQARRRIRVTYYIRLRSDSADPTTTTFGCGWHSQDANGTSSNWPRANINLSTLVASKGQWVRVQNVMETSGAADRWRMFLGVPASGRENGILIDVDDLTYEDITDAEKAQQDATAAANAVSSLTTEVERVGNKVDAQAQQITTLETSMNGFLSMGDNLIVNPGFDGGLAPWVMNGQNNAGVKWDATYGDGRPGVELNKSTAANPGIRANNAKWQALEANTRRIRVVIRARGVSGTGNIMVRLNRRNTANQTAYQDRTNTFNVGAAFDTKNYDFDAFPGGTNGYMIEVYQYPNGGVTRIDSISAYDITNAVAIDATASAVSGLTTRVQTVEGVASANAQAITQLNTKMGDFNSSVWTQMQSDIKQTKDTTTTLSQRVDGVVASVDGKADASVVQRIEASVSTVGNTNLMQNASFADGTAIANRMGGWSPDGVTGYNNYQGQWYNDSGIPYGCFALIQAGVLNKAGSVWSWLDVPVKEGNDYMVSAYVSGSLRFAQITIEWKRWDDHTLGIMSTSEITPPGGGGFPGYVRPYVRGKAPAGTAYARVIFKSRAGQAGNSFLRWVQPMLEESPEAQTKPSGWNAGGLESRASWEINMRTDNRIAGLKLSMQNTVSSFDVIADVFRISKPEGGARTEFSDGNWRVYDGNGVLRVRMGVW